MRLNFLLSMASQMLAPCLTVCEAATINYSGNVYSESGSPISGGYVIAGTFAPAFNPHGYSCFYGDPACNQLPGAYDMAVRDGNFFPAGTGGITDANGSFSLTGQTNASGMPIWLFAFEDATRDSFFQALATSNSPDWIVQSGSAVTSLSAVQADTFVLGMDHPNGISLFVIPFPEPGVLLSTGLISAALSIRIRPGRRR